MTFLESEPQIHPKTGLTSQAPNFVLTSVLKMRELHLYLLVDYWLQEASSGNTKLLRCTPVAEWHLTTFPALLMLV